MRPYRKLDVANCDIKLRAIESHVEIIIIPREKQLNLFSRWIYFRIGHHKCSQKENFINIKRTFVMKVRLIRKETIETFALQNAQSRTALEDWLEKVKKAEWEKPADIQTVFRTADLLGKSSARVVFNIAGNHYRMICKYAFGDKQIHLFVCCMGTHAAYDKLCDSNEQYTVSIY